MGKVTAQREASGGLTRVSLRVLGLIRPFRRLHGVAALGLGSIVLNVSGPWLLGRATDTVLAGVAHGVDSGRLALLLTAALCVYAGSGAFWILQGRFTTRIIQQVVFGLRERVADKLSRLPLSYFDGHTRGEVLSRATSDIDNIQQCLQQTLSQVTNSSLLLVGVLGMMFWISPLLSVVALVAVPASMWLTRFVGRRAQPHFTHQWAVNGDLVAHVEEAYTGYAVVRAFGSQEQSAAAFAEHSELLRRSATRAQFLSGLIGPITTFVGNLSYVAVAVIGGFRLLSGSLTVGELQAFIQYSRQFTQPLIALANLSNVVQSGLASADRVFAFLDEEEEIDTDAGADLPEPVRGRVRFERVSFRYLPDQPLIEDLSLTVEPGRSVAIVGPTGAGKTTLVNLLMRFYDVTGGRITVDGVDIRTLHRDALRSRTGMVLQDAWLFGGSIRENIAYGREDAGTEEVLAAARAAHVDHLIRTLPDGIDTVLDDDQGVSAGQRQLITIARAVLADPSILILDEATSAVDTRTELLIQQAMARLSRGRTTFVIAHRLSTIREADLILVMADGAIVEQGTHSELLAAEGPYFELYRAQFEGADGEEPSAAESRIPLP